MNIYAYQHILKCLFLFTFLNEFNLHLIFILSYFIFYYLISHEFLRYKVTDRI